MKELLSDVPGSVALPMNKGFKGALAKQGRKTLSRRNHLPRTGIRPGTSN